MKNLKLNLTVPILSVLVLILSSCSKQGEDTRDAAEQTDKDIIANSLSPRSSTQDHLLNMQPKIASATSSTLRFGNGFGAIETQIKQRLGGISSNPAETLSLITAMWQTSWVPSFDQPLVSTSNDTSNLPDLFQSLVPNTVSFIEMLRANRAQFLSTVEEKEAAYAISLLSSLAAMSEGDDLVGMLVSRSNMLPISKGDIVVYMALSDSVENIPPNAALENWIPMTAAANPVYRLIALEAGRKSQPKSWRNVVNKETPATEELAKVNLDKINFYSHYTSESDPMIVSKLIDAVGRIVSLEALDTLKLIRERQVKLGANDVVRLADQAIEQMNKVLPVF